MAGNTIQNEPSIDEQAVRCVPSDLARLFRMIPVRKTDRDLFVVADRSLEQTELSELEFRLECSVKQQATLAKNVIDDLLRAYYPTESKGAATVFIGIDALVEQEREPNVASKKGYAMMATGRTSSASTGQSEQGQRWKTLFTFQPKKRAAAHIYVLGENVVDLEATLDSPPKGGSITLQSLDIPPDMGLRIPEGEESYCGVFDFQSSERVRMLPNGLVRVPTDDKYRLKGRVEPIPNDRLSEWQSENNIKSFLESRLRAKAGGGGALNNAYGQQVYLENIDGTPNARVPRVSLATVAGSEFIRKSIPKTLQYQPLLGIDEKHIGWNVNISLEFGLKLTFRSSLQNGHLFESKINVLEVAPGDVLVVDSLKNRFVADAVLDLINEFPNVSLYLAATDSMVKELGREKVREMANRSKVFVANEQEFNLVMEEARDKFDEGRYPDDPSLVDAMRRLAEAQQKVQGSAGMIWVTHGEMGATVLDRGHDCYFQAVARAPIEGPHSRPVEVTNTNGCGDAFCAVVCCCTVLEQPVVKILRQANAAGHICALNDTASGPWMATPARIGNHHSQFGTPQILHFSKGNERFLPME